MTNEAKLEFANPVLGNNLLSDVVFESTEVGFRLFVGFLLFVPSGIIDVLSLFEVEFSLGELLGLFALDTIANLLKWSISNVTTPSFVVEFINSNSPLSFMW